MNVYKAKVVTYALIATRELQRPAYDKCATHAISYLWRTLVTSATIAIAPPLLRLRPQQLLNGTALTLIAGHLHTQSLQQAYTHKPSGQAVGNNAGPAIDQLFCSSAFPAGGFPFSTAVAMAAAPPALPSRFLPHLPQLLSGRDAKRQLSHKNTKLAVRSGNCFATVNESCECGRTCTSQSGVFCLPFFVMPGM